MRLSWGLRIKIEMGKEGRRVIRIRDQMMRKKKKRRRKRRGKILNM